MIIRPVIDDQRAWYYGALMRAAWRSRRTFVVLFALLAGCAGTWEPKARTAAAATDVALLAVDVAQSRWMAEHYGGGAAGFHEDNPLLGRNPSKAAVTAYCAAWAAAVIGTRIWGPKWASWALSGLVFAIEADTVEYNASIGEGMTW